jgi:hypothetical protein
MRLHLFPKREFKLLLACLRRLARFDLQEKSEDYEMLNLGPH